MFHGGFRLAVIVLVSRNQAVQYFGRLLEYCLHLWFVDFTDLFAAMVADVCQKLLNVCRVTMRVVFCNRSTSHEYSLTWFCSRIISCWHGSERLFLLLAIYSRGFGDERLSVFGWPSRIRALVVARERFG